jgi:hypothetical protein
MTILPSSSLLNKINQFIQGEKFSLNYGLFLLTWKSGLRVSEAVSFDYHLKHPRHKDLYLVKGKGDKTRYVYVNKEIIQSLKTNHWKPNQTNRISFYHFLQKTKKELNISPKIELTPHTLRRAFATYHSENGLPLPLLSKLLGHSSVRTTALYWQNIYRDDDPSDILAGKKWLEQPKIKPPLPENSVSPIRGNLPEPLPKNPDSDILRDKPLIIAEKPDNKDNSLLTTETEPKLAIISYYSKPLIRQI